MKVITYIYHDFADANSSSYKFRESCARFGYDVVNIAEDGKERNFGEVLKEVYQAFKALPPDEIAMYADGADTYFVRPINPPELSILYMAEVGLWPQTAEMQKYWNAHFEKFPATTAWKYINGGGYVGPAGLICEFFEQNSLHKIGQIAAHNSQRAQALAYMAWKEKGAPIDLDQECIEFQAIGFCNQEDFLHEQGKIKNRITGSYPALFHGNGRTPMGWVY